MTMLENQQQNYQEELESQRALDQVEADRLEKEELYKKGKSFGSPSYFKYGILFILAFIIDIMGFLDLTGVGWFLSKLVTIPCFLLSLVIYWTTNTKQKEAQSYIKNLKAKIHQFSAVSRTAIKQAAKFLGRNPALLIGIGEGLDIVLPPILSLINLSVLWVYISYRSEKRAYLHANESADSITEPQTELNT